MKELRRNYDVVIVGAGPAGLMAGYFLGKFGYKVVILEKLDEGVPDHPEGGIVTPVSGVATITETAKGIKINELGVTFPYEIIDCDVRYFGFVSPKGHKVIARVDKYPHLKWFRVEKSKTLKLLIRYARQVGVEIRFRCPVKDLLRDENGRVVGVYTVSEEKIYGRVIIGAEGINGKICEKAGLPVNSRIIGYTPIIYYLFESEHKFNYVASFFLFGTKNITGAPGIGFISYIPGHIEYAYTHIGLTPRAPNLVKLANIFIEKDPRARPIRNKRCMYKRGCIVTVRRIPKRVVTKNFIGIGDAVTPGGQLSTLPAMAYAKKAALIVSRFLETGDFHDLMKWNKVFLKDNYIKMLESLGTFEIKGSMEYSDRLWDEIFSIMEDIDFTPFIMNMRRRIPLEVIKMIFLHPLATAKHFRILSKMH